MRLLLDRHQLPDFERRLMCLMPGAVRRWGTMDVSAMLAHLRKTFESVRDDTGIEDRSTWFSRTVVRFLVLNVLPIPRGRIKAPAALFPAPCGAMEDERLLLRRAMQQFVAVAEAEPERRCRHPFFGLLTLRQWQRMHALHVDHHFRQFGV